jgi:hypothetical protein
MVRKFDLAAWNDRCDRHANQWIVAEVVRHLHDKLRARPHPHSVIRS